MSHARATTAECSVSSSDLVNNRVDEERNSLTGAFRVRDVMKAAEEERRKEEQQQEAVRAQLSSAADG
jgi:hypothetical protein